MRSLAFITQQFRVTKWLHIFKRVDVEPSVFYTQGCFLVPDFSMKCREVNILVFGHEGESLMQFFYSSNSVRKKVIVVMESH